MPQVRESVTNYAQDFIGTHREHLLAMFEKYNQVSLDCGGWEAALVVIVVVL